MKRRVLALISICILSVSIMITGCEEQASGEADTETVTSQAESSEIADANQESNSDANDDVNKSDDALETNDSEDSDSDADEISSDDASDENEQTVILDPVVIISGTTIKVGDEFSAVVDTLGDYQYESAPSCLGAGEDKIFTFDSILVYTQPDGDKDNVFTIEIDNGGVLPSGIVVGTSTVDDVKEVYGSDIKDEGSYLEYKSGNIVIDFEIEDGTVVYAEIYTA